MINLFSYDQTNDEQLKNRVNEMSEKYYTIVCNAYKSIIESIDPDEYEEAVKGKQNSMTYDELEEELTNELPDRDETMSHIKAFLTEHIEFVNNEKYVESLEMTMEYMLKDPEATKKAIYDSIFSRMEEKSKQDIFSIEDKTAVTVSLMDVDENGNENVLYKTEAYVNNEEKGGESGEVQGNIELQDKQSSSVLEVKIGENVLKWDCHDNPLLVLLFTVLISNFLIVQYGENYPELILKE